MDDNAFYQSWKNFVKEMDLANGAHLYRNQVKFFFIAPDFVPYLLRHTFCTNVQQAGLDVKSLQYLMGHSNASVTLDVYTHSSFESVERAFERIAGNL